MRIGVLLLLAGCDRLFGFAAVPRPTDGGAAHDGSGDTAGDADHDGPNDSASDASLGATKLVQEASNGNTGANLDVTLVAPPANGNTLVLIGGADCGLSLIAGGGVSLWNLAASSNVSPTVSIYYGVTNGTSGSVRVVPNCATANTWGLLTEWSGLAANGFDTMTNSGLTSTTGGTVQIAAHPTGADLLIFGMSSYGPIGSPTAEWLELAPAAANTVMQRTWYELVPAAGQYVVSVTYSSDFDAAIAGFKIAQ